MRTRFLYFFLAITLFTYFPQPGKAQDFRKLDNWLTKHVTEMGGRVYLIIHKEGKVVYSNGVNDMTPKQEIVTKIIARKQNKRADLENYKLSKTPHCELQ